jgi:hypothetical protein
MFFPNNDAVFQDNSLLIHTASSVQPWLKKQEDALQHLPWPAQSPLLNIVKPVWSFFESRVKADSRLQHHSSNYMFFMRSGTISHYRLFRTYISLFQEGYKMYYRQMVAQL